MQIITEIAGTMAGAVAFLALGFVLTRWWQAHRATPYLAAVGYLGASAVYDRWPQAVFLGLVWALCLVLADVDRRRLILPDLLVGPLVLLAMGAAPLAPLYPDHSLAGAVSGGACAALLLYAARWGYARWRHREGLGLGDVKLAVAGGALAGPAGVAPMIFLAAMATLLAALALHLSAGAMSSQRRLPFGPGLCAGMILVVIGRHYGVFPL